MPADSRREAQCNIFDSLSSAHRIEFVLVAARFKGKWVFIKHRDGLYELPGGHIKSNETPLSAARRKLYQQTGIVAGKMFPVCCYSLFRNAGNNKKLPGKETYGQLFYVEVFCQAKIPEDEDFTVELSEQYSPDGKDFTKQVFMSQIMRKISSWLEKSMKYGPDIESASGFEKVCGVVSSCLIDGKRHYLLIRNLSGHVGFPKGHVENGETEYETASREVLEETGIKVRISEGFRRSFTYPAREKNGPVHKTAVYFTGTFSNEEARKVLIQEEEILAYWLLPVEAALQRLNQQNDRNVLIAADEFLSRLGPEAYR